MQLLALHACMYNASRPAHHAMQAGMCIMHAVLVRGATVRSIVLNIRYTFDNDYGT